MKEMDALWDKSNTTMSFERKILFGFGLAVIVLILLGTYSYKNNEEYVVTSKLVTHTNEVLYNVERMLVATQDIVLGQRGFELTANERFLEPYNQGVSVVFVYLSNIQSLTKDNVLQQKRLDTLKSLLAERVQFSKERVDAIKALPLNMRENKIILPVERVEANLVMNQIRLLTERIQNQEKRLLAKRIADNENQITEFDQAFTALLLFIVILLVLVFLIIRINLKMRRQSEEKAKAFRTLLETSIESQKEVLILSIDTQYRYLLFNTSHKESTLRAYGVILKIGMSLLDTITNPEDRAKVKSNFDRALAGESYLSIEEFGDKQRYFFETRYNPIFNEEHEIVGATAFASNITERKISEQHLQKITEDLSVANQELDSFCYSVSHDLRAPLRSINGYSRILVEDFADKLSPEGRTVLGTVMKNALKMGNLIDDLLNFSRIGKTGLSKTRLDMEIMANEIKQEQVDERGAQIDFDILPLKPCIGDPNLIKQVWTNLVSNAIKYSGKKDAPKIEIGSTSVNGTVTYYVKDNGVGFDMHYANKLFGVFQRLHKSSDFEGTGVGLAIVNRIVNRHGGKVWAESKPNEGATFYFSLPAKP